MTNEQNQREVLFRIGDRNIVKNELYCIIGPCGTSSRHIAASYDLKTNKSTWVSPDGETFYADGRGLMAVVRDCVDLKDAFDTPRPYIYFPGGVVGFDRQFRPTIEQITVLQNWYEELDKAGIGGASPDLRFEDIKEEFRKEFSPRS